MTDHIERVRDANNYIVEKDAEWVKRWEDREHEFRKMIHDIRAPFDSIIKYQNERAQVMQKTMHDQQAIILRIRDDIPFVGKWIIKWAERGR